MNINLIGKFSNTWGAEHLVLKGLTSLGHHVRALDLARPLQIFKQCHTDGALTIVMQGYGLSPQVITQGRRLTRGPWVLWHAEVMSPEWPTNDQVVQAKAAQLEKNAYAFDAVAHNCHCCLHTVDHVRGERGKGKPVIWAPANGVDAEVHRRLPNVEKRYPVGFYGYPSPRRIEIIHWLRNEGIAVEWRTPEDGCFGERLIEFINECQLILNCHFSQTRNLECRIYESLGCGVPVISEPVSMPEVFTEGAGITYVETIEELPHRINHLLNRSTLEDISNKGYTLVHSEYSYARRCKFLLEQIGERLPKILSELP